MPLQDESAPEAEVVIDFAQPLAALEPVRAQRSTTILAELASLREMGHFDRYCANLSPLGQPVLSAAAGGWIPMPQLEAHYDACAAIGLTPGEQFEFGAGAAKRCVGTLLGTAVQVARRVGATPWTFLEGAARFWSRSYVGGGLRVLRLAPKEVRVDFAKNPLHERAFYRSGFRGYAHTFLGLFCTRLVVREQPLGVPQVFSLRAAWA